MAASKNYLGALYDHLKQAMASGAELNMDTFGAAVKHARGVAGGKAAAMKSKGPAGAVMSKLVNGVPLQELTDDDLAVIHEHLDALAAEGGEL